MMEADLLRVVRMHVETLFPKTCQNCGNTFTSPRDFFQSTTAIGSVISYDANDNNWQPENPLGTFGYFNCGCGNTLVLATCGMDFQELWKLMHWVRTHCEADEIPLEAFLNGLREKLYHEICQSTDSDALDHASSHF